MQRTKHVFVLFDESSSLFYLGGEGGVAFMTKEPDRARQYALAGRAIEDASRLEQDFQEFRDDEDMEILRPQLSVRRISITLEML